MGRLSYSTRATVVELSRRSFKLKDIQAHLLAEGIEVSKKSLCVLIGKYKRMGSVADERKTRRPRKLGDEHLRFIDDAMAENDELTSSQLYNMFQEQYPEISVSISTIKRVRRELGWVAKRTRYCAMIAERNKEKRVEWCQEQIRAGDLRFANVVWTDECTVQLESHRLMTYHRIGEAARLKPRPKHPLKIHVWGGISARGATKAVMFSGIMNATRYTDILDAGLVPFLEDVYPDGHRFQQDNDPKHTSRYAQRYYEEKDINWWKTPASSPDLNPIENVWGAMKLYLRDQVKPKNLTELKAGIRMYWKTLTPEVCRKFIGHLRKVIPKVIEVNGGPSGF